jgi:peptidoglycan hydrolase-like protein with peptidoglycan-binding domain
MRNVIKLTESQLKKIVKDTINEQATKNYFAVYEKADGVKLKPTKDPNQMMDSSSNPSIYIWNTGRVMAQDVADNTIRTMGNMIILSDDSYNIVWVNGYTYDSVTDTVNKTKTAETPKINTANCANQLVDIANDPTKRKILKFGCKTQAVKELQTLLGVFGKNGTPTGYFGSKTKQPVIDYQKKNQLVKKEGIVGSETYKALTPNAVQPTQDLKEEFDYESDDESANEYLNSLFNTEDDYDGEPYRGDEEGFSNKLRQKHISKSLKMNPIGIGDVSHYHSKKKEIEVPRDEEGKEIKWSPMKSDDLPLDKYLEKKKMGNLDEEDLTDDNFNDYLDSLFV